MRKLFIAAIALALACVPAGAQLKQSGPPTPSGSSGQLQYNSSGAFGADSTLTFDATKKRLQLGGNAPTTDDTALIITKAATNPLSSGGSHAVRDESTYSSSGSDGGYSSFDSIPVMGGSITYNHIHSFQSRINYSGSGTLSESSGLTMQLTHQGSGTITSVYGIQMLDALGSGPIGTQVAVGCVNSLTRGSSNYCIYSGPSTLQSFFGGRVQFNTAPIFTASGFTGTFGQLTSLDTSGNLLSNPNLTIVNGVLTMSNVSTARVLASASGVALNLRSSSGNVTVDPNGSTTATFSSARMSMSVPISRAQYTVSGLPAGTKGDQASVTDAAACAFGSTPTGGGTAFCPVTYNGSAWVGG